MEKEVKVPAIDAESYENMLRSSIAMTKDIREKSKGNEVVSQTEADFVNDFETYFREVMKAVETQEELEEEV